jgi:hypothetical protein
MGTLLFIFEIGVYLALVVWAYRNETQGRRSGASGLFAIITDPKPKPRGKRFGAPSWQKAPEPRPAAGGQRWRGASEGRLARR